MKKLGEQSAMFVFQLQKIASETDLINNAIKDYYYTFAQRTKLIMEGIILSGELEDFVENLVDQWQKHKIRLENEKTFDFAKEEDCQKFGRKLFDITLNSDIVSSSSYLASPIIVRGSYHLLADQEQPSVYWHPRFFIK